VPQDQMDTRKNLRISQVTTASNERLIHSWRQHAPRGYAAAGLDTVCPPQTPPWRITTWRGHR
jgi:hypothetical protein